MKTTAQRLREQIRTRAVPLSDLIPLLQQAAAKHGLVLMPSHPTRAMLKAMSKATYLTDGSDLEMHRRWNGALDAASKSLIVRRAVSGAAAEIAKEMS